MYDLIIIGMGISGISAAIYAKRNNLKVLVLEKNVPGGLLNKINVVENYPGLGEIKGPDLSYHLFQQFNDNKIEYKIEEVKQIVSKEDYKEIETNKTVYQTKFIIIATGRVPRNLGLENEKKLIGKGISTCALCDGNLYRGKDIAVVGGGNSALEETIYLSKLVNKIYLIHRKDCFSAEDKLIDEVKKLNNVEMLMNTNIVSIEEKENKLDTICLDNGQQISVSALFEYIGYVPANDFTKDLNIINDKGYIEVDNNYETKINNIYAVGDSIEKKHYQLITAASEGASAAINIISKM